MNRIFVISDTHFGHKKIIEFEAANRPFATVEEHDEELARRWNAAVKPKDTVWHLGDVLFGRDTFKILRQLNGVKKLVMGNHDRYPTRLYLEHFSQMVGSAEIRDCILTHVPVHPLQFGRYKANIHGHLHSKSLEDGRYINASAECIGLTPMPLDDLLPNVQIEGLRAFAQSRSNAGLEVERLVKHGWNNDEYWDDSLERGAIVGALKLAIWRENPRIYGVRLIRIISGAWIELSAFVSYERGEFYTKFRKRAFCKLGCGKVFME